MLLVEGILLAWYAGFNKTGTRRTDEMNNFQNNLDASVDRLMNASYALGVNANAAGYQAGLASAEIERLNREIRIQNMICLLYTSDAADD